MAVKPIPDGYHTVTPYLTVADAAALLDFLQRGLGAKEKYRHSDETGRVRHAEVQIGDSMVMVGQAREPWTPKPTNLYLYVDDVDAWYERAVGAGGKSIQKPANQFYGDRTAGVEDSQGNSWWLGTHVEDVTEEEMVRRMKAAGH